MLLYKSPLLLWWLQYIITNQIWFNDSDKALISPAVTTDLLYSKSSIRSEVELGANTLSLNIK